MREAKLHGVDYIKIYTTQDFVGQMHMWKPDATLVNSPSLDFDEVSAITDEAHRLGLKVACHTYGGDGMFSCLNAGVDAPNHLLELDEDGIKVILEKHETFVPTIDDLIALEKPDLKETDGRNSRLKLMEQAFRRALAAGVTMAFGSGSTSPSIPHGKQGNQFAYFVKWGMSPAQALQMAYLPAARMLNYGWDKRDREPRERQVRRSDRGQRRSAGRSERDGAGQVRDEGRNGRQERPRHRHALEALLADRNASPREREGLRIFTLARPRAAPRWRSASARRIPGGTPPPAWRRPGGSRPRSGWRSTGACGSWHRPCRSTIRAPD